MRQYEVEWIDAAGKHRRFVAAAGTERAARELFRRYCGAAAGGTVLLVQEVAASAPLSTCRRFLRRYPCRSADR